MNLHEITQENNFKQFHSCEIYKYNFWLLFFLMLFMFFKNGNTFLSRLLIGILNSLLEKVLCPFVEHSFHSQKFMWNLWI